MKFKYIPAIALASVMLMSGCSVIEKVGSNSKNKVTAEAVTPESKSESVAPKQQDAVKNTDKKSEKNTKTTGSSQHISPATPPAQQNKNVEVTAKDYEKLNGEWAIMSVFGERIVADEHPMIYFEASSRRFYGNNGCNTINGGFTIPSHSKLQLTDFASTMMLCPDAPFEYKINQALGEVAGYELSTKGHDSYLILKSAKGITIATLHRSDNAFIDGAWQVMAINGDRMAVNDEMRLVIDVTEGRVHGNAGCNMVNGKVLVDSEQTSSIQFSSLMTTRMTCPDQAKETALLVALENVISWKKDGNTHAVLTDAAGKELVKLRKLSREELGM